MAVIGVYMVPKNWRKGCVEYKEPCTSTTDTSVFTRVAHIPAKAFHYNDAAETLALQRLSTASVSDYPAAMG